MKFWTSRKTKSHVLLFWLMAVISMAAPLRMTAQVIKTEGRSSFHGLDLSKAPRTTAFEKLPDLWEERPVGSRSFEVRKDTHVIYSERDGTVYHVPEKNCFYIQSDPLGSSTMTFYGPFPGDPVQVLRLKSKTETVKGKAALAPPRNTSPVGAHRVAIYLITDHPKDLPFAKTPLTEFTLADEPLISEQDIVRYDWESHTIQLKQQAVVDRVLRRAGLGDLDGFVVVADGQRVYRGAMVSDLSSRIHDVPVIKVGAGAGQWQPALSIRIHLPQIAGSSDPRGEPRLKQALQELSLLSQD